MSLIHYKNRIYWLTILLIVFMLGIFINTNNAYALTTEEVHATGTSEITLNREEVKKNQTQEKLSVDEVAESYEILIGKLQNIESQKQKVIKEYKEEQEKIRIKKLRKEIVKSALSKKGCDYVWGAVGPNDFDCSGLTQWSYRQNGVEIPRVAASQAQYGKKVEKSDLQIGDLIFFRTDDLQPNRISHVGMYIGNGQMVHAPETGDVVRIANINKSFWKTRYAWSCRYL